MIQIMSQDEEIIQLIDRIYALKDNFIASKGDPHHELEKKDAITQLHSHTRKLMLVGQDPNAAFWELVRRVSLVSYSKFSTSII